MSERTEWQQKGYDAYIEVWVQEGCSPTAGRCPARYMQEGRKRTEYIQGWSEAKRENEKL